MYINCLECVTNVTMYLSFILQTFIEREKTYQKISRRRNRRHLCWPRSSGSTPNRRLHQVYLYNKLCEVRVMSALACLATMHPIQLIEQTWLGPLYLAGWQVSLSVREWLYFQWLNDNIINACAGYVQSVDQYMYMCLTTFLWF